MRIEHQILIGAAVDKVWRTIENVAAWPDWTPTVSSAQALTEGPFGVGSRFALKQPLQPRAIWEVTACTPHESFAWEQIEPRKLFRATHQLDAVELQTRSTLVLEVLAPVGRVKRAVIRLAASRALRRENAGLKAFCERELP